MSESSVIIEENKNLPLNKGLFILLASILLSTIFNILFYGKIPGISYLLFTAAFYILFFINFRNTDICKATLNNFLLLFILLLSLTYTLFTNEVFMVFNTLALPILVVSHTMLVTNKNQYTWFKFYFITDIIYGFFYGAFAFIFKPFAVIRDLLKLNTEKSQHTNFKKVSLGLLISVPLLFIIIPLLSSADSTFGNIFKDFGKLFTNLNTSELKFRFILFIIITFLTFSYMWFLTLPNKTKEPSDKDLIKSTEVFDPVTVITILISINLVYMIFVIIQFSYLFSQPENLSYAQYARKGFFELILVTLINLTILLSTIHLTKKADIKVNTTLKVLNMFLIFCTGIMLISAHFKMSLYQKIYGYTYLRVFTQAFMLYILALLIATLCKILFNKIHVLKLYIIISLIAYTLINFANVDTIIAKNNIARYRTDSKQLDIYYLTNLSYEAVPELLEFLPELKQKDSKLAAILENDLYRKKNNLKNFNNWQSFNFSIEKAKKALSKYELKYDSSVGNDRYMFD